VVQAFQPARGALGAAHSKVPVEFIDPRTTPFVPLKSRGDLPHLYKPGCCHFVTFRLRDAVVLQTDNCGAGFPACTCRSSDLHPTSTRDSDLEEVTPQALLGDFDPPLRQGSCSLAKPEIATIVQSALLHFHHDRYELVAWCIMPNHVHVIFAPLNGFSSSKITQSWKGYTAREANRILNSRGAYWERESFDHLIRNAKSVERFANYVEENPVAAGLCSSRDEWPYSSAGSDFQSPLGARQMWCRSGDLHVQAGKPAPQ